MSIWGIPWGSWKESKKCPVSMVRLTFCLHLESQQIGLRCKTPILVKSYTQETFHLVFVFWWEWQHHSPKVRWKGTLESENWDLGQLCDRGPVALPNALKDRHQVGGMVMTMIPHWVVTGIKCNVCKKCSGKWRVHAPGLGTGSALCPCTHSRLSVLYNYCASSSRLISF